MGEDEQNQQPGRTGWLSRASVRAALAVAWPHLLVALPLLLVAATLYLPLVHTPLDYEDGEWIRGTFPGYRSRVLQVILMNRVLLPLLSHRVEGYFIFAAALHLACALLIYGLVVSLVRNLRTTLSGAFWPAWAGGALGGVAFLAYEADNLTFLSGLSYQLFCLFGLASLLFALRYFTTRRLGHWLASVGCVVAALLSHSYGLALPLFIAALELTHRRARVVVTGRWDPVWRYGLPLLPVWFFLVQLSSGLTSQRVSVGRLLSHLYDPAVIQADLLHLANYLEMTAVVFLRQSHALPGDKPPLTSIGIQWSDDRLYTAAALALVLLAGGVALVRRSRVGVPAVTLLFAALWSGLTFHQTLFIGYDEAQDWRFYHNAAGFCVALGFMAATLLNRAPAMGKPPVARAVSMILVFVVSAMVVLGQPVHQGTLSRLLSGELSLKNDYSWTPPAHCKELKSISVVQLEQRLASRQSLACRDLSHMHLAGLDFSGQDLRGADLTGANLWRATLRGANLQRASLCFADLAHVSLMSADLRGANLTGANLSHAELTSANLQGVVLVGAFRYNATMGNLSPEQVQRALEQAAWKEAKR